MRIEANTTDLPVEVKAGVVGERITVSNPQAVAVFYIFAASETDAAAAIAEGEYFRSNWKTKPVSHEFSAGENLYAMSSSRREATAIYVTG